MMRVLGTYKLSRGNFGIPATSHIKWYFCRDYFHQRFDSWILPQLQGFFYVCTKQNTIDFIEKLETHLNIKPRTTFVDADKNDVLYIKPSKFWLRQSMRMSFFTIALRSSLSTASSDKNWLDVLLESYYFTNNRYAAERFLEGYTFYTAGVSGRWMETFYSLTKEKTDKKLRKPGIGCLPTVWRRVLSWIGTGLGKLG
jgi:hypothetical protein